ncbi:MAG: Ribokinase-like protein [Monoraphidium minutum]|nr:MAG: Ribokinase-like protein [Monoraphidium minutum]
MAIQSQTRLPARAHAARTARPCAAVAPARARSSMRRAVRAPAPRAAPQDAAPAAAKVVCLGEALYDYIADQKGVPREEVASWTPYPGGAPANVATALARLGAPTAFIAALGSDEMGDRMVALLQERGVDVAGVQRTAAPTRDVYVVRRADGDREFAGFGLESSAYCDTRLRAAALPLDKIRAADFLVMGTLGLASPETREAMEAAVKAARAAGCKVFVDINWRPVFWPDPEAARPVILDFIASADLVKISDADLAYLYDLDHRAMLKDPCAMAAKLPRAAGVLVTAGDEGAAYCFRSAKGEHSSFVHIYDVDVADTTGAGDAFTAGFLYKMLEAGGLEALAADPSRLRDAVAFGAATGALTCTRPGAIASQPELREVEALVDAVRRAAA